jgi:hypothetical protein
MVAWWGEVIVYRRANPTDPAYAVAEKQIYASHDFETALDLTICIRDAQRSGFYIITVKGSKQAGLTRSIFLLDPHADTPSGMFVGFDIMRQLP